MAANATITVNDGATTPVAHSFDPAGINGNSAKFQNRTEVLTAGREILTATLKSDGKTVRTINVTMKIPYVVDETMNAVTNRKVASFLTAKVDILVPVTWTPTQAKVARGLVANVLNHATIAKMVEDDEFVW